MMGRGLPGLSAIEPTRYLFSQSRTPLWRRIRHCAAARPQKTPLDKQRAGRVQICTKLVSLTLARAGCAGGRRVPSPPAVVLRLSRPSAIPAALGAATGGAQSTQ